MDVSWLHNIDLGNYSSSQEALLEFGLANKFNITILCVLLFLLVKQFLDGKAKLAAAQQTVLDAGGFADIEALPSFNWQNVNPIKLRNFKPKYFMTMAIENLDPSELLVVDRTYVESLKYRQQIIQEHGDICIGVHDDARIRPAVIELYVYLLGHYLPKRFPTMFRLHQAAFESGDQFMLHNTVTNQMFPTAPSNSTDTRSVLSTLGRLIDTDFLFLLPEDNSEDPKYKLEAYVCICPSGWDPREKLGQRLASIHKPVPGYKEKLEGSMDRYFKALEVGKFVKRSNWSITVHEELFMPDPDSNHDHGAGDEQIEATTSIDPDKTFLRCERQTLNRLPKSKAILFAFKTYMDSMRDLKLEGVGDGLAAAIDGLGSGNVPTIGAYKRAPFWGQAVKDYLRSAP